MNKLLMLTVICGFLSSCAETRQHTTANKIDPNTQKKSESNVKYTCSRDIQLSVNFISTADDKKNNIAIINGYSDKAIMLPKRIVTSGFLYSNGKYALRAKGEQVTWTVGRMAPFYCSIGEKSILKKDTM